MLVKYFLNLGMKKVISPNKPVYAINPNTGNPISLEKGINYKLNK